MGRPRKDAGKPAAEQRMVDAFWALLEDNSIGSITVAMIAAEAGVNRGTFYYHYADMDALVYRAIELELVGEGAVMNDIFDLTTGSGYALSDFDAFDARISRMALAINHGGMELVTSKTKAVVVSMWRAALCPDGSDLQPEARLVVEYATSGIIGVLAYRAQAGTAETPLPDNPFAQRFLQENSTFLLDSVSRAQGLPKKTILERLAAVNRYARLPRAREYAAS